MVDVAWTNGFERGGRYLEDYVFFFFIKCEMIRHNL